MDGVPMRVRHFSSAIPLILGAFILLAASNAPTQRPSPLDTISAQLVTETPMPTLVPTPTPRPTASSQEDRLSASEVKLLDERLDALETEIKDLDNPLSAIGKSVLDVVGTVLQSGWLVFAIICILTFRVPIGNILGKIGSVHLKFGEFELSTSDVDKVVREREILRMMLAVATIDNDPAPEELAYIANISKTMDSKLDVLEDDDKLEIIRKAIGLAVADKEFKAVEYGAIKTRANQYKISDDQLETLIREGCQAANVPLPSP
jgi:hypothetical protein